MITAFSAKRSPHFICVGGCPGFTSRLCPGTCLSLYKSGPGEIPGPGDFSSEALATEEGGIAGEGEEGDPRGVVSRIDLVSE